MHRLRHRDEHIRALNQGWRAADNVHAVRDQCVFELKYGVRQTGHFGRSLRVPCRLGACQIKLGGLRLNHAGQIEAFLFFFRAKCAPAGQGTFEFIESAIQPCFGNRRGQITDQRGVGAALGDRAFGRVGGGVQIEVGQITD